MPTIKQNHADPFQVTASSTMAATATVSGSSSFQLFLTDITASSDNTTAKSSTITISTSSVGAKTTIWQDNFALMGQYGHSFVQPIQCNPGDSLVITVTTTPVTAVVNVNGSGFKVHLT